MTGSHEQQRNNPGSTERPFTMTLPLESATAIRLALGSALDLVKRFDALPREREKTSDLRDQMLTNCLSRCAACNVPFDGQNSPIAAHILALEDGGLTTPDNVLLLCRDCHALFDSGYASRREMAACATEWRNGRPQPIRQLMQRRLKSSAMRHQSVRPAIERSGPLQGAAVYDLIQAGKWRKALNALQHVATQTKDPEMKDLLCIVMAQVHRRRAARGVLTLARVLLESVRVDRLPKDRLPLYYYEYAYVHQLEGKPQSASRLFALSARCADDLDDEYSPLESVIGRAQELAAVVIQLPSRRADTALARETLRAFDTIIKRASSLSGAFAGRWVLNSLSSKAYLLLKVGRPKEAYRACEDAIAFRHGLDVTTGWTRLGGSIGCGIVGLTRLRVARTDNQVREGLRFIARALVPALAGNSRRPECVRDFLLAFQEGLISLGISRFAAGSARIKAVRPRILDGSSFLDPYRAPR